MHNIICFEAEWLYNNNKENRFNLKTESLLTCIKEFYGCKIIYRQVLHKQDLSYYLRYFREHKRISNNYPIIYIASHGDKGYIHLEDGDIDLFELAEEAKGFFENKVIHFSCCKTLSDPDLISDFKNMTKASLVTGYSKSVDAMKSAIADIALFNSMMHLTNFGTIKNQDWSSFRKTYKSLLEELGFEAY